MLSREGQILFLKLNLFASFIHLRNYGEFRTPSTSTHGRTRKRALRDGERERNFSVAMLVTEEMREELFSCPYISLLCTKKNRYCAHVVFLK